MCSWTRPFRGLISDGQLRCAPDNSASSLFGATRPNNWRANWTRGALSCRDMCRPGKDDADRTFEEESRPHNQRALSASNGLAFDASARQLVRSLADAPEFNCDRAEGWRGRGWKREAAGGGGEKKGHFREVALGGFGCVRRGREVERVRGEKKERKQNKAAYFAH